MLGRDWYRVQGARSVRTGKVIAFVLLVLIAWIVATAANKRYGVSSGAKTVEKSIADTGNITTRVDRFSDGGWTAADFTESGVQRLKAELVNQFVENARSHISAGIFSEEEIRTGTTVSSLDFGSQRLALLRFMIAGRKPIAIFIGLRDGELVQVFCQIDADADVPLSRGPCDNAVRQVFGVSMNSLRSSNG